MSAERIIRTVAGSFILITLLLGVEASPFFLSNKFLWFTAFVGANLFQSGITKWCLLSDILAKFGIKNTSC
ncbi:MAG: DUF2892 domain-containing protein [Gallionella sp.]|nr:DUF2892 domain-containing protein [Gallionella sp.]